MAVGGHSLLRHVGVGGLQGAYQHVHVDRLGHKKLYTFVAGMLEACRRHQAHGNSPPSTGRLNQSQFFGKGNIKVADSKIKPSGAQNLVRFRHRASLMQFDSKTCHDPFHHPDGRLFRHEG